MLNLTYIAGGTNGPQLDCDGAQSRLVRYLSHVGNE